MPQPSPLVHSVYFSLVDSSEQAKSQLIAKCKEHLSGHPGMVYFAVGALAEDIRWSISDRDFDVVVHLVFESRAAHDEYQDSPRHAQFIDETQANWKQIRCFDAYLA